MRSFYKLVLDDIFKIYGSHETLTTERIAMELERRVELLEYGKSDLPSMSETDAL